MFNRLKTVAWVFAIALLGTLVVTGSPTPAHATIVLKLDTADMGAEASSIVMGRVEAVRSFWDNGRILTEVDVRVALPVKGIAQQGAVVTLQQMGGRVDDLVQWVPGTAQFMVGEQTLVFLEQTASNRPKVVMGLAQGKYQIAVGPDERLWAVRDLNDLSLAVFEETASGERKMLLLEEDAVAASNALPLDRLLSDVAQGLVRQAKPVPEPLRERLGEGLTPRGYDFARDFKALDPRLTPADHPEVTP
ncbi:MAG: hypothetical protein AAFX99_26145 [Myxococcota bacterium]